MAKWAQHPRLQPMRIKIRKHNIYCVFTLMAKDSLWRIPLTAFTSQIWPSNRMNFNVSGVPISMKWRTHTRSQQIGQGDQQENKPKSMLFLFFSLFNSAGVHAPSVVRHQHLRIFHFDRGSRLVESRNTLLYNSQSHPKSDELEWNSDVMYPPQSRN